jgi:hypothetical protein
MSLTIIHYIIFIAVALLIILGVVGALTQNNKKLVMPMILSTVLFSLLIGVIAVAVTEKYTKKVKLVKVSNKRFLSQEKIAFYGMVKNVGKFPLAKVYFTVKLVNAGHVTGKEKAQVGGFYKPSGFFDFFQGGMGKLYKPQTIEKEFVVAKNLKPGEVVSFHVMFDYPPYFQNVSHFVKVSGH